MITDDNMWELSKKICDWGYDKRRISYVLVPPSLLDDLRDYWEKKYQEYTFLELRSGEMPWRSYPDWARHKIPTLSLYGIRILESASVTEPEPRWDTVGLLQ